MQRWRFRREREQLAGRPVFYLDACGVDHRLYRERGRAPRGERIYEAVAGKRRERTRIISASREHKLVAPFVFQGSCNTEVVDVYFEQGLLPELPPGSVIVLDNARFHQSPTTQKLVAATGCQLLFLPAYSPDLNRQHEWNQAAQSACNSARLLPNISILRADLGRRAGLPCLGGRTPGCSQPGVTAFTEPQSDRTDALPLGTDRSM